MRLSPVESPGDKLELDAEHELAGIYAWRVRELDRAGYDDEAAVILAADLDVDLHEAIALLKRGCSVELALRILL